MDTNIVDSKMYEDHIREGFVDQGIYAIWAYIPTEKVSEISQDKSVFSVDLRGFYNHFLYWYFNDVQFILIVDYEINDLFWNNR